MSCRHLALIVCFPVAFVVTIGWMAIAFEMSPERKWYRRLADRCQRLHGEIIYDRELKSFECWRTPFMRHPKKLFAETFAQ